MRWKVEGQLTTRGRRWDVPGVFAGVVFSRCQCYSAVWRPSLEAARASNRRCEAAYDDVSCSTQAWHPTPHF